MRTRSHARAVLCVPLAAGLILQLVAPSARGDDIDELDRPIATAANRILLIQQAQSASAASALARVEGSAAVVDPAEETMTGPGLQDPDPTSARPAAVLTPIQGPLMLEGRYLGDISGEVGVDGQGTVDSARLIALLEGVVESQLLTVIRDRIAGRERVSLTDLRTEEFSLTFDTFSLAFLAQLAAGSRAQRSISFSGQENIDPSAFDPPSGFSVAANVGIGQAYDHQLDEFRGFKGSTDLLVNWGGFDGVTLTTGFDYDEDSEEDRFRRREIRLTKDLFDSAIRLTAGEFSPAISGFQGSNRILGLSAGRAYSVIRPFQNIRPSGRREFVLDRPSFVEVEVNGIVLQRLQLDPGPYSLSDFPFAQGGNTIRILVDDNAGQREVAVFDLYGGSSLLDREVVDFGVSVGALEEGDEFEYGDTPAFSAFVRKGLTDVLSAGGAIQWVDERYMVEGSATWGTDLGLIEVAGAASRNEETGLGGFAASLDYLTEVSLFERDDTRFIITAEAFSPNFQNAFERLAANPAIWRIAAQVSSRIKRYTVNFGASAVKGRGNQGDERSVDLSVGRSLGRFGINASLGHRSVEFQKDETRFGISLTLGLGGRWNAQTRYESAEDFKELVVRRSSTGGLGDLSGGLRVSHDSGRETIGGDLRYINNRFDAELVSNRLVSRTPSSTNTTQESRWLMASRLAYADGTFAVGRPAREAFVIAKRHPSLAGSRVALTDGNGRDIALADWFGPAVAPIDRAYSAQRLVLEVDPLPNGYDLGTGLINVFPGYGNGYVTTVGSDASRTAVGVLVGEDGSPLALVSGTIERVQDRPVAGAESKTFFTNRGGRFVGDGLAPGRYRLLIGGVARGEFIIPEDSEGVVDVGRIQITGP